MATRQEDWMAQAERDLGQGKASLRDGYYEWACFAAHQAAEKAVKAVYQKLGGEARGHSITALLKGLATKIKVPGELANTARELDKNYIPTRYPNAHQEGAPFEMYTESEARRALDNAETILRFCRSHLA